MFQPLLHCKISDLLCKELSNIEFAKKGFYTPSEFLGNKFLYIIKRLYRYYRSDKKPPNFPYSTWIKDYTVSEMTNLNSSIKEIFKISEIRDSLNNNSHHFTEGYWHKFTNVVNLNKITTFYRRNAS